jgi:hypothetical protein
MARDDIERRLEQLEQQRRELHEKIAETETVLAEADEKMSQSSDARMSEWRTNRSNRKRSNALLMLGSTKQIRVHDGAAVASSEASLTHQLRLFGVACHNLAPCVVAGMQSWLMAPSPAKPRMATKRQQEKLPRLLLPQQ